MMGSVVFVRHGQSEAQVGLPSTGLGLAPLTSLGRTQAGRAATRLYRTHTYMPRILASSYQRAIETGTLLMEPWASRGPRTLNDPELPFRPTVDPELPVHEFTFLAPENRVGTTATDRVTTAEAWWNRNDPDHVDGPGAESLIDLFDRVERVLRRLYERIDMSKGQHDRSGLYVVSHARFMQAVLWHILHGGNLATMRDVRRFRSFCIAVRVPNTGMLELKSGLAGTWTAGSIDDDHVPPEERTE